MKRWVAPLTMLLAMAACGPLIMTRPANVDAGGFDCVRTTLQRLGYMITDGDRSLGFVRAERTRGLLRETDVLVVNYIVAGTVDDESEDTIQVRASRPSGQSPSRDGVSDAESLLDECGKLRVTG
ncbi:hypothetical protein [Candidatus Palauibacter sp.]|uniref:hypothetical protein n=1 Tax=Candidatus Palauibacter sp. TaxID=3101350 RepID=UPI003B01069A